MACGAVVMSRSMVRRGVSWSTGSWRIWGRGRSRRRPCGPTRLTWRTSCGSWPSAMLGCRCRGDGPVRLSGLAAAAGAHGGPAVCAQCGAARRCAGDDEPAGRRGAGPVRVRGDDRGAGRQPGAGGPPVQRLRTKPPRACSVTSGSGRPRGGGRLVRQPTPSARGARPG